MMKKNLIPLIILIVMTLVVSCSGKVTEIDPSLLPGKWVSGTEYWRYDSDGTGSTWDVGDDVSEEEGQPFKWEFDESDNSLTQIHWMEMTGDWTIPQMFTITVLNDSVLSYKHRSGTVYTFARCR